MKEPKDIRILIVEDEPALRSAMVFDFKRKGFDVQEAENGTLAFEIIKQNKIDIVLTDVRMPNGDGVELLDNIKSLEPSLPVVMFITGFADISAEDAYDKGVDAIFAKPFDRKALFESVLTATRKKEEQWSLLKEGEINPIFNIELSFPEKNQAIQGRLINFGRGGMFISLSEKFPALNAQTNFKISFESGDLSAIRGMGIVRWIRSQGTAQYPSGCGVEFTYLDEDARTRLIKMIESLNTKSFIPKV